MLPTSSEVVDGNNICQGLFGGHAVPSGPPWRVCVPSVRQTVITLDLLCTSLGSSGLSGVYFHIKTFYWDYAGWDYRALGRTKPTKEGRQQSTRTASVWELPSGGQGGTPDLQADGLDPGGWGSLLLSLMPALGAMGLKKAILAAGPAESLPVAFLLLRCAAWWVWSWVLADAGLDFLDVEIPKPPP